MSCFKAGLSVLGVLEAMCTYYDTFKEVLCFSSAETFTSMFSVSYSEEGSNNRGVEGLVLSHWNDFLQDVEENLIELSFSAIIFFCYRLQRSPSLWFGFKFGFPSCR